MATKTIKDLVKTKTAKPSAAPSDKWVLVDEQDRGKLCEGRTQGMGFALCKRTDRTLVTVCPTTACKDFLNEIVVSEANGKPYSYYGLSTSRQGIFDDHGYLVIGILMPNRSTTKHGTYDKEVAALSANIDHIQYAINHVEGLLKLDGHTVIEKIIDNRYAVIMPKWWCETTYGISLITLLLRASLYYTGGDPIDYWTKLDSDDAYMLKSAIPKLKRLIAGERPTQDFSKEQYWHNLGIVTFPFPEPTAACAAQPVAAT